MRSLALLLLTSFLPAVSLGAQERLSKHQLFPDFSLRDSAGGEVTLADFAGTDALFLFVPSPFDPALGEIRDRWAEFSRLGIAIRAVCLAPWQGLEDARRAQGLPFPLLGNGRELANRLHLSRRSGPGVLRRAYLLQPAAYLEDWFDWDDEGIDRILRSIGFSVHLRGPERRPFETETGRRGAILVEDRGTELLLDLELEGVAAPEAALSIARVLGPSGDEIGVERDRSIPAAVAVGRRIPAALEVVIQVEGELVSAQFPLHGLDEHAIFLGRASDRLGGLELEAAFWESLGEPLVVVRLIETAGKSQYFRNGRQGCTFGGGTHRFREERFNPKGQWGRGGVGCSIFRDERRRRPTAAQLMRWRIPPGGGAVRVYGYSVDRELPEPTPAGFRIEGGDDYAYDEEALEAAVEEWKRIKDMPENQAPVRSPDGRPLLVKWSFHSEILTPQARPPDWLPHDWEDVKIRFSWAEGEEPRVSGGAPR